MSEVPPKNSNSANNDPEPRDPKAKQKEMVKRLAKIERRETEGILGYIPASNGEATSPVSSPNMARPFIRSGEPYLDPAQLWYRNPNWSINIMLRAELARSARWLPAPNGIGGDEAEAIARLFGGKLEAFRSEFVGASFQSDVPATAGVSAGLFKNCRRAFFMRVRNRMRCDFESETVESIIEGGH